MRFDIRKLRRDYGDPQAEALACRRDCALFDFSFMARLRLEGRNAVSVLARLTSRPMRDLPIGRVRYALRENRSGHLVADLTIWRLGEHRYEIMSGRHQDIADAIVFGTAAGCRTEDLSAVSAVFALQGPRALAAMAEVTDVGEIAQLGYFACCTATLAGVPCLVGRLGYTGEAGFEIILDRAAAPAVWGRLSGRAKEAGFAAADILRMEAGFLLFANELRIPVTAREAGLARFAASQAVEQGGAVQLVAFTARTVEAPVLWQPPHDIARPSASGAIAVTSACHSALAGRTLGLGYVRADEAAVGTRLRDPWATFHDVEIAPLPFFDPRKRRPRAAWPQALSG